MLGMGWAVSSAEAIRAYIVTLRKERGRTIDDVADAIKMPRRTYIEWEQGRTKDIKTPFAMRAVRFLMGSIEHLEELDEMTQEQARELALEVVKGESSSQRERALALIDELLADPVKLNRWLGYGERLAEE